MMTAEEVAEYLPWLRRQTEGKLQVLVKEYRVQDPKEGGEALVQQLLPIVVLEARWQGYEAWLCPEAPLIGVSGDGDREQYGWFAGLDRDTGILTLVGLDLEATETKIPVTFLTEIRRCRAPGVADGHEHAGVHEGRRARPRDAGAAETRVAPRGPRDLVVGRAGRDGRVRS